MVDIFVSVTDSSVKQAPRLFLPFFVASLDDRHGLLLNFFCFKIHCRFMSMKESVPSKGETRRSLKSPPGKNIRPKHDLSSLLDYTILHFIT